MLAVLVGLYGSMATRRKKAATILSVFSVSCWRVFAEFNYSAWKRIHSDGGRVSRCISASVFRAKVMSLPASTRSDNLPGASRTDLALPLAAVISLAITSYVFVVLISEYWFCLLITLAFKRDYCYCQCSSSITKMAHKALLLNGEWHNDKLLLWYLFWFNRWLLLRQLSNQLLQLTCHSDELLQCGIQISQKIFSFPIILIVGLPHKLHMMSLTLNIFLRARVVPVG